MAFYAGRESRVLVQASTEIPRLAATGEGDLFALDEDVYHVLEGNWIIEKEFTGSRGESMVILAQRVSPPPGG